MFKKVIRKRSVKIVAVIALIWCIFFSTDFIRAVNNQRPVFAITHPVFTRRDGGSTEYFGIGYKIIVYISHHYYTGEILFGEIERVDIGTWFMRFRR